MTRMYVRVIPNVNKMNETCGKIKNVLNEILLVGKEKYN